MFLMEGVLSITARMCKNIAANLRTCKEKHKRRLYRMRQQFLQDACRYHRDNDQMDKLLLSLVVWWMPRWILEGMAASQVIQVNSISNGGKTKLNLLKELMKGRKDARGFKRTSRTDFNSTKTKLFCIQFQHNSSSLGIFHCNHCGSRSATKHKIQHHLHLQHAELIRVSTQWW